MHLTCLNLHVTALSAQVVSLQLLISFVSKSSGGIQVRICVTYFPADPNQAGGRNDCISYGFGQYIDLFL